MKAASPKTDYMKPVHNNTLTPAQQERAGTSSMVDNRPEALAQRKLDGLIQKSPGVVLQKKQLEQVSGVLQAQAPEEDEELMQGKFIDPLQRQSPPEEEEELMPG